MSLIERRDAAVERREALRRERSAALLDSGTFSPKLDSDLAGAEREIEAVEAALNEGVRRERDLQAQAEDERFAHARSSCRLSEAKRLDAVERAEKSARELAGALRDALEAMGEIEMRLNELQVRPLPIDLWRSRELERRLSGRLASILTTVRNHPRFGGLPLRVRSFANPSDDWREAEERLGVVGLSSILEKETTQ